MRWKLPATYHLNSTIRSKKGFTLVELMVVISIIAILSTIGLTVYTQTQKAARDSKKKGDIQEIRKALEQFYAATSSYPTTIGPSNIDNPTYFPEGNVPKDPAGNSYSYSQGTCSGAVKYVICSTKLENGNGNNTAIANDPCSAVGGSTGASAVYYCVGSLSN